MDCILVHYSEIALKGQNRRYFEKKLARNIKESLPVGARIKRSRNGIIVQISEHRNKTDIVAALSKVSGISNFSFAVACKADIGEITKAAISMLNGSFKTFKVAASRSDKSFSLNSAEIERQLGAAVVKEYKLKADMKSPEITVHVDIGDEAYIYTEKFSGLDGLPVGSSGRVVTLLSGGIDSPVAAWMAMKRGCRPLFLHFHALRSNEVEKTKIADIVKNLLPYCLRTKIYYVPYSIFQLAAAHIPSEYELIIFRRFMNRIAEEIAKRERAKAIVTGESIAQVASQTLENIAASEEATQLPIIRPLIAFNKNEIIELAKRINTYDLSILDYKDCCSIVSRHPKTKPKLDKIKMFESTVGMSKLIEDTIKETRVIAYKYGKGNIEAKEVPVTEILSS